MFATIHIVSNCTKEGYATREFDNIFGYIGYDNKIIYLSLSVRLS